MDDSKTSRRAAARAAQAAERARAQRRGRLLRALGIVVAALAVIVIVAIVAALRTTHTAATTSASNSVVSKVTSVPTSAFNAVGPGTIQVRPRAVTGAPALKDGSKPRVVYAGAEYCPYCAAERWAVVAALSRFGTFKDLGETTSSAQDVFPSTPTLSFHGSSYTSDYLSFSGTEMQSNQRVGNTYAPLDKLSSADEKLLNTYDTDKYTGAGSGSIPFLDLGGRFITAGASYTPQLFAGLTHQQVADKLADPTSPIAKAVDGTANVFTADLCQLTGNKPAAVCSSPGVTAAR